MESKKVNSYNIIFKTHMLHKAGLDNTNTLSKYSLNNLKDTRKKRAPSIGSN